MKEAHLSIFSDASYNCQRNQGAYAFAVELHGKEAYYSNNLPYKVCSAKDAEILALGHALNFLLHEPKLTKCDSITIHIDNKRSITEVEKGTTPLGKGIQAMWYQLISKVGSKNSRIVHVKAHSSRKGKAYDMNDWCDRNARVELRKLVGGSFMPLKNASLVSGISQSLFSNVVN